MNTKEKILKREKNCAFCGEKHSRHSMFCSFECEKLKVLSFNFSLLYGMRCAAQQQLGACFKEKGMVPIL